MYNSKAAITSLGVMGPVVAIAVIAAGMFGLDLSADVAGLPEKIAGVIDQIVTLVGIAVGIYGRVMATKQISGVFKAK